MLLSSPKARLITFFKTRLILSQQLTNDRSYTGCPRSRAPCFFFSDFIGYWGKLTIQERVKMVFMLGSDGATLDDLKDAIIIECRKITTETSTE